MGGWGVGGVLVQVWGILRHPVKGRVCMIKSVIPNRQLGLKAVAKPWWTFAGTSAIPLCSQVLEGKVSVGRVSCLVSGSIVLSQGMRKNEDWANA